MKEKRGTLKPVTKELRRSLNVSVSETDHQDLWQRAEIACAAIGTSRTIVEETLRSADRLIATRDGIRVIDTATEYR